MEKSRLFSLLIRDSLRFLFHLTKMILLVGDNSTAASLARECGACLGCRIVSLASLERITRRVVQGNVTGKLWWQIIKFMAQGAGFVQLASLTV
jgi:hypothetical protein